MCGYKISSIIDAEDTPDTPQNHGSYSRSLALLQSLSNFDPTKPQQEEAEVTSVNHYVSTINSTGTSPQSVTKNPTVKDNCHRSHSQIISANHPPSVGRSPVSSIHCPESSKDKFIASISSQSRFTLSETHTSGSLDQLSSHRVVEKGCPDTKQTRDSESNYQADNITNNDNDRRDSEIPEKDSDSSDREYEIWGPPEEDEKDNDDVDDDNNDISVFQQKARLEISSEAGLSEIHAVTALFRRPSAASKRYGRKPISKLFMSLDVPVESFLRLQGAAKSYMLDERYPERREVIGSKRRAENDMSRLKLYSCVKYFLENEGWGERCFGPESERVCQRKYRWPESKHKIIKLITPLMRRMVTNERQRQYAIERRLKKKRLCNLQNRQQNTNTTDSSSAVPSQSIQIEPEPVQIQPDPVSRLSSVESDSIEVTNHVQQSAIPKIIPTTELTCYSKRTETFQNHIPMKPEENILKFYVNILQGGKRIKKIFLLICPMLSNLVRHVIEVLKYPEERVGNIQILTPCGLVPVFDEDSWAKAIALVTKHEWMDHEVRCLVNLEMPTLINLDTPPPFNFITPILVDSGALGQLESGPS